jgi:hypothetical protein
MSLPCNVVRKCVGCSGVHMRPDADPCGRAYPCGRALWRFLWSFLSRRSGRRCRMSHDVGPVHGGSTDRRLAHEDAGVRVRGGARGRYRVWTQDGIVFSLCALDILTCRVYSVSVTCTASPFDTVSDRIAEGHLGGRGGAGAVHTLP